MKRFLPLLILFFACAATLSAVAQVVHVKGVQSIEAGYGISAYGSSYYAGYVRYFNSRVYGKASAFYWTHEDRGNEVVSYGIEVTPAYTLFRGGEKFYFNARAGILASMDKLATPLTIYDAGGRASEEDYGAVKFGVLGGAEMEYFITDKFVFILGGNQQMLFGSKDLGTQRWIGYAGIRFNL